MSPATSSITDKQKRHLRSLAHALKPVVMTGNAGLSEAVLRELDIALAHHELIKVRVNAGDRDERRAMTASMCTQAGAVLVQEIGHIAVLYRPADKPKIVLPTQ